MPTSSLAHVDPLSFRFLALKIGSPCCPFLCAKRIFPLVLSFFARAKRGHYSTVWSVRPIKQLRLKTETCESVCKCDTSVKSVSRARRSLLSRLSSHDYRLICQVTFKTCHFCPVNVLASYDGSLRSPGVARRRFAAPRSLSLSLKIKRCHE